MIHNNLFYLWKQRELALGRPITIYEMAAETGIQANTIKKWLRQDVTRFDEPIVLAFMRYFDLDNVSELLIAEKDVQ